MAAIEQEQELTPDQRAELAVVVAEMERRGLSIEAPANEYGLTGPETDDELWQAVFDLTGYKIPRVAVCPGHAAPFDVFADLYFERTHDVLWIASRGSGKTTTSGFLHGAKSRWRRNYKSLIMGANNPQAGRGYAEFKRFIRTIRHEILESLISKTRWWHGSETEIAAATLKQTNGPHPHLAQLDEAELVLLQVFEEFQNMAQGDENYPSQNFLTTTRKFVSGLVQQIVRQCEEDIAEGNDPEWDVRISCVFEALQQQSNCRSAPENADRPESELCTCDKVIKGKLTVRDPQTGQESVVPRSFDRVCGGRAYKSRGFIRLEDTHRRFKRLGAETWEAQQECLRPDPQGLVHKWMNPNMYVLPFWAPRPGYGSVYRSWDWGGTNPHAVLFHQLLDVPVDLRIGGDEEHELILRIPEGSMVTFDEIYTDKVPGERALGSMVAARTETWQNYGFDFEIAADFCDPAGGPSTKADARGGFEDYGWPTPKFESRACPRIESVKKHKEWGEDGRLYVVGRYCPNLLWEYSTYHYPKSKDDKNQSEDPVKVDDHAMDSVRIAIWNLYRRILGAVDHEIPSSVEREGALYNKQPPMLHPNPGSPMAAGGRSYLLEVPGAGVSVRRGRNPGRTGSI